MIIRTAFVISAIATLGCSKSTDAPKAGAAVSLNGSGSTLQKAYEETAIEQFKKAHPGVTVNYSGGGSGKGRQDLADQVVDFAGSDSPYKEPDLAKNKGGEVLHFPILLEPITVSFNIEGVTKLQLSAPTIAKIFQREIKSWNDPAIAADNPDAKLPDLPIAVAHRADGSGTTDNFTKYLADAAKDVWKLKSGSTVEWPADTQAGQGNSGVAQIIKSTKGAVGYVDLSDAVATKLTYASIKNQAGKFVEPTAEGGSAAGEGIEIKPNLVFSPLNAKGDTSYPITAPSWVIVYAKQTDKAKGEALKAYVQYLVGDGQKLLKEIDFAPLPKSLQEQAQKQLAKLMVP